jgi:hypothetical protein
VPERLYRPHPLVERTKADLEQGRADRYGIVRHRDRKSCLDIRVSKASLPRALRLMDALIKALEARGHEVEILPPHLNYTENTRVVVGGDSVQLTLREAIRQHKNVLTDQEKALPFWQQPAKYRHSTDGTLLFTIDQYGVNHVKKRWVDGRVKLEDQLNAVIIGILTVAEHNRVQRLQREAEERRRRAEEERRLEAERRQREEEQRRKDLERMAERWFESRRLRLFIQACEQTLAAESETQQSKDSVVRWLRWAREHADRIDPMRNGSLERSLSDGKDS